VKATSANFRTACRQLWGEAQTQKTLAPGVIAFDTAGHGGIIVDPAVFPLNPKLADGMWSKPIQWTFTSTGEVAVSLVPFEEDADITALLYHHPELIEPAVRKHYIGEGFGPDYWAERVAQDDYYAPIR
jgi:hypothetical protein